MKDFVLQACVVVRTFKYENFTSSSDRLREKIALKGVPHVQHDYFFSVNQSNYCDVVFAVPVFVS